MKYIMDLSDQDTIDFAKGRGWKEKVIDDNEKQIDNPVTAKEVWFDAMDSLVKETIDAERKEAKQRQVEPITPFTTKGTEG